MTMMKTISMLFVAVVLAAPVAASAHPTHYSHPHTITAQTHVPTAHVRTVTMHR
jgi:hypothetical protein